MIASLLIAALLSLTPSEAGPLRDSCERIETNHCYDGDGRLLFTQVIFWREDGHVAAWRMDNDRKLIPQREPQSRRWLLRWSDEGRLREVSALSHDETWLQFDPELVDRASLPVEQRRGLRVK